MSLTDANYSNFTDIINYLNDSLGGTDLETARGYSINSNVLDEWKSFPQGLEKTKQSNDRIDLIIILYRQKSPMSLKNGGYVLGSGYSIDLKQKVGIDGRSEFVDHGANAYGLMRHEFAHTLIGGNNWHTQGGRGPRKVLPIPGGYGILSSFGRISESWNAYDRYRLGWKPDTNQYFISARRADNNNEVNSAFEYGQAFQGNVDTFILRDFVTYGDAIQIQLPHLKADNSSVQHQYLWIENRQSLEGNIDMGPKGKPGIYAYLQIGKDDTSNFGEENNYIYFLNAFGNYDMDYDLPGDRLLIDTDKANPLTGVHMAMEPVWDLDGNGQIYGNEWLGDPSLSINGQPVASDSFNYLSIPKLGSVFDKFSVRSTIDISSNPPAIPILTWQTRESASPLDSTGFDNRTIHLNGLSIEILEEIPNTNGHGNDIKVRIRWDDWLVDNDVRWCGPIHLHDTLLLHENKIISLERGRTPTRPTSPEVYEGDTLFTSATEMTLRNGSRTVLYEGSTLYIRDDSRLVVEPDARIVAEDSACIVVEDQGVLELRHNNNLTLNGTGATVIIKSGGTLRTADSVDFTFSGSGYLQFHAGAIADLGNNSRLLLAGSGTSDTLLWLHPNAVLDIDSHAIDIRQGTIVQQSGAQLVHQQAPSYLLNVDFRGNNGLGYKAVAAPQVELYHTRFYNHSDGVTITDIDSAKGNFITISNGTFSNISNNAITLERIQRRVQVSNTTISNSDGLYGIKADSVAQLALHHSTIGTMTTGIHHTGGGDVLLYNTIIDSNYTGIYAPGGHVFLRDNSYIRDNTFGIDMPNGTSDSSLLVIGDIGCGHVIGHSHTAIKGTNIVLHIDALQHAAVPCQDTSDVAPNRFDGNTKLFDICYQAFSVDTVYAMGNYWDNGQAPAASKVDITNFIYGPGCKEEVVLRSGLHATTLPTGCLGNSGELGNCDSITPPFNSVFFSDRLALNDTVYIATYMGKGYYAFLDSNLALAELELTAITGEPIDSDTTYTGGSKHMIRLARMLVPTVDRHAAYDVAPASESGKKGLNENQDITQANIRVFPNPVQQTLYVQGIPKSSWLILTDVQGRIAKRQFLPAGDATVNMQSLTSGFYVFTLQDEAGIIYHRDKVMVGR